MCVHTSVYTDCVCMHARQPPYAQEVLGEGGGVGAVQGCLDYLNNPFHNQFSIKIKE